MNIDVNIDLWRLCSFFFISAIASPVFASGPPGDASPGEALFARVCATCHGAKGEGAKGPPIVPLIYPESQMAVIVRSGQGEMPPISKAALTDAELAAIVAYLSKPE